MTLARCGLWLVDTVGGVTEWLSIVDKHASSDELTVMVTSMWSFLMVNPGHTIPRPLRTYFQRDWRWSQNLGTLEHSLCTILIWAGRTVVGAEV